MHASPAPLPLREVVERRIAYAERRYRQKATGRPTRHHHNVAAALTRLLAFVELEHARNPSRGPATLLSLTKGTLRAWMDEMSAERQRLPDGRPGELLLSRGTINAYLQLVKQMVEWAEALELCPESVKDEVNKVKRLKEGEAKETEPRVPTDLDVARFLDQVRCTLPYLTPTPRDVVQLLMLSGARIGEILGAVNSDVRPPEGEKPGALVPAQHKNAHRGKKCRSRIRVLPLCAAAWKIVERRYKPMLPGQALFPRTKGGSCAHFHASGVQTAITRACKRAGVPRYTPHMIRHAVARWTREHCGLDIAQVLLGHSSSAMTEHYAPPDPNRVSGAMSALEVLG